MCEDVSTKQTATGKIIEMIECSSLKEVKQLSVINDFTSPTVSPGMVKSICYVLTPDHQTFITETTHLKAAMMQAKATARYRAATIS